MSRIIPRWIQRAAQNLVGGGQKTQPETPVMNSQEGQDLAPRSVFEDDTEDEEYFGIDLAADPDQTATHAPTLEISGPANLLGEPIEVVEPDPGQGGPVEEPPVQELLGHPIEWVKPEPKILTPSEKVVRKLDALPLQAAPPIVSTAEPTPPVADPFPNGIPPLFNGEVIHLHWGNQERLIFTSEKKIRPEMLQELSSIISNYLGDTWRGKVLLLDQGFKIGLEHIEADPESPPVLDGEG